MKPAVYYRWTTTRSRIMTRCSNLREDVQNKVIEVGINQKPVCNFLLVINSKATGNSRSGIPGNSRESRTPKIPDGNSREFRGTVSYFFDKCKKTFCFITTCKAHR